MLNEWSLKNRPSKHHASLRLCWVAAPKQSQAHIQVMDVGFLPPRAMFPLFTLCRVCGQRAWEPHHSEVACHLTLPASTRAEAYMNSLCEEVPLDAGTVVQLMSQGLPMIWARCPAQRGSLSGDLSHLKADQRLVDKVHPAGCLAGASVEL
eukprot:307065-Amphidinium_carterae.1